MKVFLTRAAEDCLWAIWDHDRLYSESLADSFQRDIDRFIRDAIGANPEIGHVWHALRGIRRLIFRRRHNIFYTLRDDAAFVLFIFDGRMDINQQIAEAGLDVEALIVRSDD
ncbi:type II toxin-antitoxin system RelE/ParE family toxin [Tabrizicola oligotrophica]|uniref:Type II toxin-antitoxin system RelE/ParE family toxin n=1 Tax=Tabrizicola oligotrophica TaxID=2710650 RepID=A0A6M0QZ02_9RHOB|nr:type II toxin-antitoxin system RelE/ParE family toxin [Tabrizicola oligotrophica]NEY92044.1 type II toxin-antitoxin system RelE/ParE family toxin [Tabrizicola oligotrophica]